MQLLEVHFQQNFRCNLFVEVNKKGYKSEYMLSVCTCNKHNLLLIFFFFILFACLAVRQVLIPACPFRRRVCLVRQAECMHLPVLCYAGRCDHFDGLLSFLVFEEFTKDLENS